MRSCKATPRIRIAELGRRVGLSPPAVADRLLATLRRYGALCRRHKARVRAVATSAVREARNGNDIVRRVKEGWNIIRSTVPAITQARTQLGDR